jgi:hypothetical protein
MREGAGDVEARAFFSQKFLLAVATADLVLYEAIQANKENDEESYAECVELYCREKVGRYMHVTSARTRSCKADPFKGSVLTEEPVTQGE